MIKHPIAAIGLAVAAMTNAIAAPLNQPPGAQSSYVGDTPPTRVVPGSKNPATPSLSHRRIRFGILSDLGAGFEIGSADDFDRYLEQIVDDFDNLEFLIRTFDDQNFTPSEVVGLINDIIGFEEASNALVRDFTDSAYAKIHAGATGPGAPLSIRFDRLGGVLTFDYAGYVEARVAVESRGDAFDSGLAGFDLQRIEQDARLEVGETADGYALLRLDPDNSGSFEEFAFRPNDEAGIAVQGGIVRRLSGGYSREIWSNPSGTLHAGAVLHFARVTLARSGALLDAVDDTAEVAEDEFDNNQETSSGLAMDAGLMWVTDRYSAGAMFKNLNAPSFDYPDPCSNGASTSSCQFFAANPQAERGGSSWTMERQLTLEGALYTRNRRWVGDVRLDANSAADSTGDEYQWAAVYGRYLPQRSWIPSPRVGYKRNLAGERLNYLTAGATFFRALHLDAAYAREKASFDGRDRPRALEVSLGLRLPF